MRHDALFAAMTLSAWAIPAAGQLVMGTIDSDISGTSVWHMDVITGDVTPLFGGVNVQALAVDSATNTIWGSTTTELFKYTNEGGLEMVATFSGSFNGLDGPEVYGLAFARGQLYATSLSSNAEGFHTVNTETGEGTLVELVANTAWSMQSFAYDPGEDLFYGSDFDTGGGRGLYYTPTPSDNDHIFFEDLSSRAMAIGDGRIFAVATNTNSILQYDLDDLDAEPTVFSDAFLDEPYLLTGAGFGFVVPAPGAMALLTLGGVVSNGRRRR